MAAWLVGCALVLDFDYDTGSGVTTVQGDGSLDVAALCEASTSCSAPLPAEWSRVAYAQDSNALCPDGYGNQLALVGVDARPSSCACSCSGPGGTCDNNIVAAFWEGGSCVGAPSLTKTLTPNTCDHGLPADEMVELRATPPNGVSCDASFEAPPDAGPRRDVICAVSTAFSCRDLVCVPNVTAPFRACVAARGTHECPPAFPESQVLGSGDPGFVDRRTCAGCTCEARPCRLAAAFLNFYTSATCLIAPATTVDAACQALPVSPNGLLSSLGQNGDGGTIAPCEPTAEAGSPEGGVDLNDPWTVCCGQAP
jgi:hypothetical protein